MTTAVVLSTCFRFGQVTRRISSFNSLKYSFVLSAQTLTSAINVPCAYLDPQLVCGWLAGAEGFEPPLAVLETAGLPLNLRPCVTPPSWRGAHPILLDFLMGLVLAAVLAELLHFQALGRGLLILG